MFEDITLVDVKILSLYTKDYASKYSMREITQKLHLNYSHAFKRIKQLITQKILLENRQGHVNVISLNIQSLHAIQLISFVEQQQIRNSSLELITQKVIQIDPSACIGLFGSRVSGKATKESDWDVFILTQNTKEMNKIMSFFPHINNIQIQVFSLGEFRDSLLSSEETVVKHIIRNKQIIYNPYPFYNLIRAWEMIKYAPTQ